MKTGRAKPLSLQLHYYMVFHNFKYNSLLSFEIVQAPFEYANQILRNT